MNRGDFAGRLGREAVLKTLPSGKSVVNFPLAVDTGRGENKQTLWVDCSLWGDRAQKIGPYLTKGKQVALSGRIDQRLFTKKDGTVGGSITCDVDTLTLMGGRETNEQGETHAQVATPAMRPSAWGAETPQKNADPDDDIPF